MNMIMTKELGKMLIILNNNFKLSFKEQTDCFKLKLIDDDAVATYEGETLYDVVKQAYFDKYYDESEKLCKITLLLSKSTLDEISKMADEDNVTIDSTIESILEDFLDYEKDEDCDTCESSCKDDCSCYKANDKREVIIKEVQDLEKEYIANIPTDELIKFRDLIFEIFKGKEEK